MRRFRQGSGRDARQRDPGRTRPRAATHGRSDRAQPGAAPGQVFADRFEVVRKLGTGTFGTVYHAFDKQDYCDVALKIPSEDILFNPQFMVRFRAEAEILERMRHPNIVTFYDAQLEVAPRFLVAELIKGRDLEQEIIQTRKSGQWIPRSDAVSIVEKLARALHHAHRKKVIHRDVKPANIMIGGDVVKLTDFGLARFGDPNMTQAGTKIGTPFYMAPEQVTGNPTQIDARSDQYSLGVVLYELLCRRRPFEGPTAESVYMKIVNELPTNPTAIDPSISRELAGVCLKALAKDPARRWPGCDSFASALRLAAREDHPGASRHDASRLEPSRLSDVTLPEPNAGDTESAARLPSTVVDPVAKGHNPIASLIGETINMGKSTFEPITSAVEPLGKSLGTTVRISSRTIRSRWPRWVQAFFGWLTAWVDLLNDKLRRIEEADEAEAFDFAELAHGDASASRWVEPASVGSPIPLASVMRSRPPSATGMPANSLTTHEASQRAAQITSFGEETPDASLAENRARIPKATRTGRAWSSRSKRPTRPGASIAAPTPTSGSIFTPTIAGAGNGPICKPCADRRSRPTVTMPARSAPWRLIARDACLPPAMRKAWRCGTQPRTALSVA